MWTGGVAEFYWLVPYARYLPLDLVREGLTFAASGPLLLGADVVTGNRLSRFRTTVRSILLTDNSGTGLNHECGRLSTCPVPQTLCYRVRVVLDLVCQVAPCRGSADLTIQVWQQQPHTYHLAMTRHGLEWNSVATNRYLPIMKSKVTRTTLYSSLIFKSEARTK